MTTKRQSEANANRRKANEQTVRELIGKAKLPDNLLGEVAAKLRKSAKKEK